MFDLPGLANIYWSQSTRNREGKIRRKAYSAIFLRKNHSVYPTETEIITLVTGSASIHGNIVLKKLLDWNGSVEATRDNLMSSA